MRNLTTSVSEEGIRELFEEHGRVERVKKIKDYAFVHFEERKQAIAAMQVGLGLVFELLFGTISRLSLS